VPWHCCNRVASPRPCHVHNTGDACGLEVASHSHRTQVWVRNSGPGSRYPSLASLALPHLRALDVSLVFGNRTGVRVRERVGIDARVRLTVTIKVIVRHPTTVSYHSMPRLARRNSAMPSIAALLRGLCYAYVVAEPAETLARGWVVACAPHSCRPFASVSHWGCNHAGLEPPPHVRAEGHQPGL